MTFERSRQEPEYWIRQMAGRTVFITGGTGFFGKSILDRLLALPKDVQPRLVLLSRNPRAFLERFPQYAVLGIEWVAGNLTDFTVPLDHLDYVLHMAAEVRPAGTAGSLPWFDSLAQGTHRVLDCSLRLGASRVLLASSGAVYGPQPPDVSHLDESRAGLLNPTDLGSSYALGKCAAEHLGCLFHAEHGLSVTQARCFTFVGPHLPLGEHFAIGNFMHDALRGQDIKVQGDGTAVRSYMHTDDLVEWLMTILLRGRPARAYNVGSDVDVTIADLAHRVARHATTRVAVRIAKQPDPNAVPQRYVPSIERARQELGLELTRNLDEAIESTITWHSARRVS